MRSLRTSLPAVLAVSGGIAFGACSARSGDGGLGTSRQAASVSPTVTSAGTCEALGYTAGCTISPVANGTCMVDGVTVTVSNFQEGTFDTFDWAAAGGVVNAVLVSGGGSLAAYYDYGANGSTGDTDVTVPENAGCGTPVTRVSFCVGTLDGGTGETDAGPGDGGGGTDAGPVDGGGGTDAGPVDGGGGTDAGPVDGGQQVDGGRPPPQDGGSNTW